MNYRWLVLDPLSCTIIQESHNLRDLIDITTNEECQ